jgi:hypothetical protein
MVLDSTALVTFFCGGPGADRVAVALEQPTILCAVSALELARSLPHVPARELLSTLRRLGVNLIPLEGSVALEIGAMPLEAREGAAVAAVAKARGVPVFKLELPETGHGNPRATPRPSSKKRGTE